LYIGWVLFIALLTLLPGQVIPHFIDWNFMSLDKVVHFTMFTILALLGSITLRLGGWQNTVKYPVLVSILFALAYGSALEFTQSLVPQRTFDFADLTANAAGAAVGTIVFIIFFAVGKYE